MIEKPYPGALVAAGALLGMGLGGFLDGIVLHQILQWHNMLSSVVTPDTLVRVKFNMLFDGLFHAMTWAMTAVGLALLWRASQRADVPWTTRTFVGSLSLGWGLFNVVEGLIDHHLLGLHHVHPGNDQLAWDLGFLVLGVALTGAGLGLIRRASVGRPRGA